ncbi:hypothetical protein DCAR_0206254 [Daucus carota subsp. sativus]|uniref:Uncharacterized protein n=1 Tax=Daucus carota subsp. sativus TaxID=79200 RepID=A0A162ARA9_DAUCS|nr:hypothetical protein DCAR_0206254 [Daucus carota subsp. sativus]
MVDQFTQDSTNVPRGNAQQMEGKKKWQLDKILKHWFLLDYDLVEAINKGNHSLMPMAIARVNYLIGKVPAKLLAEGINGEEEALWSIHELLYNNGCWEKANNLVIADYDVSAIEKSTDPVLLFLNAYTHLIHPNTRVGALKGKREDVRMALNQIHYSSIEAARQSSQVGVTIKNNRTKFYSQLQEARQFISAHSNLVEPSVLKDAMSVALATTKAERAAPNEPQQQEEAALQETVLHTSNWIPREADSSCSLPKSSTDLYISEVDNNVSEDGTVCSEVLAELQNLKVQVKRGRPRKYKKPQLNKHFKLPRKKKTRGEGLKQTTHYFLNAGFDEAEAIYETGRLMGLLPSDSKERSIELIKENL